VEEERITNLLRQRKSCGALRFAYDLDGGLLPVNVAPV